VTNYSGNEFAAIGRKSDDFINSHNLIAVHSKDFDKLKLKTLRITQGNKTIDAQVVDLCADNDCGGCCTQNQNGTGFLIDMHQATQRRTGMRDGKVEWFCVDC
jgi:hypothetical protein